jgi:hypothetical protein
MICCIKNFCAKLFRWLSVEETWTTIINLFQCVRQFLKFLVPTLLHKTYSDDRDVCEHQRIPNSSGGTEDNHETSKVE